MAIIDSCVEGDFFFCLSQHSLLWNNSARISLVRCIGTHNFVRWVLSTILKCLIKTSSGFQMDVSSPRIEGSKTQGSHSWILGPCSFGDEESECGIRFPVLSTEIHSWIREHEHLFEMVQNGFDFIRDLNQFSENLQTSWESWNQKLYSWRGYSIPRYKNPLN